LSSEVTRSILTGLSGRQDPGPQIGVERKPNTKDLVDFCRLTECLDNIHFQSTGLISADVPHPIADIYRLYIGLMFSRKPVVTGLSGCSPSGR